MEFSALAEKLAGIREKIATIVEKINAEAAGEAFYARFFLENNRRIVGLINNLRTNEYKIVFNLTEDKLVDGNVSQKVSKKEIKFEELRGIDVFKTKSGKPMFI